MAASNSMPSSVSATYKPENALDDLPAIKHALYLFFNSHMVESEKYCDEIDPRKERLYIASGYSLIQCMKGLLSAELPDLQAASEQVKHGNDISHQHRAPPAGLTSRIAGLVWENASTGVGAIRNMTVVQRHAELLYAETLFARALLGVVCSGNWLTFLTEAFNFRTMINTYLSLGKFLDTVDGEAHDRGEQEDTAIDKDFRSGVELGVGASNLILSFMPSKLLSVAAVFGYNGDRDAGLALLMKCGGWVKGEEQPKVNAEEEGLRRVLADTCLLCFHLVISSITTRGVDLDVASTITAWNLKRYPNSVFFMFAEGRLALLRSNPSGTITAHRRAITIQSDYRSLHFISYWESAIATLALWNVEASLQEWRPLREEATWSKATYYYGTAACLLQINSDSLDNSRSREAETLLNDIPTVVQKIAGKSIPIEKFVSRKARKFASQGNWLFLPAMELAYMFEAITHSPRDVLLGKMIPDIEAAMIPVEACRQDETKYRDGTGANAFWDDYCLGYFLMGSCWRIVAYPDENAMLDNKAMEEIMQGRKEAEKKASTYLRRVLDNGHKIRLDHYIRYHTHYELGKLLYNMERLEEARENLEIVVSGKSLETTARKVTRLVPRRKRTDPYRPRTLEKGKYSMQSQLQMRAQAVIESIDSRRPST